MNQGSFEFTRKDLEKTTFEHEFNGYKLRHYQSAALENAFRIWDSGSVGALIRAATGTGKTLTAAAIIDEWLRRDNERNRVIILCHERQLVKQFAREVNKFLAIEPAIEMASFSPDRNTINSSLITVASRQTLYQKIKEEGGPVISRLHKFDNLLNWLCICDEAHRYKKSMKSVQHIFEYFEQNVKSVRLGITATPWRDTDKISLNCLFDKPALDYPLYSHEDKHSSVKDGYSVPYRVFNVKVEGVDFAQIKESTLGGVKDYSAEDLEAAMLRIEALSSVVQPTIDIVGNRRTIVFSPTVNMALAVQEHINTIAGDGSCRCIHGKTPDDERTAILNDYENDMFQFLSACMMCQEGWDSPGTAAVAVFRPTKSRARIEQMCGRASRVLPGVIDGISSAEERVEAIRKSDKPDAYIINLVGMSGLGGQKTAIDIMAEGLPDEIIEHAVEASEGTGSYDPIEIVEDEKEKDRKREEEKARKEAARLQAEKVAKEQRRKHAAEMQALSPKVNYYIGDSGDPNDLSKSSQIIMKFGKFKGVYVYQLPDWYLKAFVEKSGSPFRYILMKEIGRRNSVRREERMNKKELRETQLARSRKEIGGRSETASKSIDDINKILLGG